MFVGIFIDFGETDLLVKVLLVVQGGLVAALVDQLAHVVVLVTTRIITLTVSLVLERIPYLIVLYLTLLC